VKKDIFKDLNDFNQETSDDVRPLMATFSGQLFKSAPCFLSKIKMDKKRPDPLLSQAKMVCVEKDTTLNALGEYAKKEMIKTHNPVIVAGDERYVLKCDVPLPWVSQESMEPTHQRQAFFNDLLACRKCFENEQPPVIKKLIDKKSQASDLNLIDVLFVGDYPRLEGDGIIETFSADRGEILNRMVQAMNLPSLKWCVTYLLKCNRMDLDLNLKKEIINTCFHHVKNEIFLLQPKMVISFGALATQMMLGKKEKLADIHGKFFSRQYDFESGEKRKFTLVPIFHPEYLLLNPTMKKTAWVDLKKVMEFLSQEN